MAITAGGTESERNGAGPRFGQLRRQVFPGYLSGNAAERLRGNVPPHVGPSQLKSVLDCDWKDADPKFAAKHILFTGAIDEFLDYRFGPLPYRSLSFEEHTVEEVQHQPVGTINYPNNYDYTRITEQKIITGQRASVTTLMTEYPRPHEPGKTIAYYPIPRDENRLLYAKYAAAARSNFQM
jgi:UDP-galactopyranose mutase